MATTRAPSSQGVKGAIKARLRHASVEKAYAFLALRFIIYASGRFCLASLQGALQGVPKIRL